MSYDALNTAKFQVPDAQADVRFDKITRIASRILKAPICLLTMIDDAGDRQLLKSAAGVPDEILKGRTTPLSHSFCKHVRDTGEPLVVTDARKHPLLKDNPAITEFGIVSYLGIPFHGDRGMPIGALCCISPSPKEWEMEDVEALAELVTIADDQFQLDIAIKARVKAKLIAEKAVATRASFLSHANHEVRTPLSAISGASRLLKALAAEEKVVNLATVIERNTSRLKSLTNDFLRISELDNGFTAIKAETYDIAQVVEDVVAKSQPLAKAKNIDIHINNQFQTETIFLFDGAILTNVLDRLVSNAIKFTAAGGITIAINAPAPERIEICVSDTGIGMDLKHRAKIFEEFEGHNPSTARTGGGSGLGMNIIQRESN
ncbi:MAG: GAF domain-containing sensor histidine kinase [Sulfitobacter sp.]|uniref:GAF domain-containing sensor histidine kinase n=1 Tax=Sulfitobacter sp. TaxID=1903071 RepID=UPI0032975DB9